MSRVPFTRETFWIEEFPIQKKVYGEGNKDFVLTFPAEHRLPRLRELLHLKPTEQQEINDNEPPVIYKFNDYKTINLEQDDLSKADCRFIDELQDEYKHSPEEKFSND